MSGSFQVPYPELASLAQVYGGRAPSEADTFAEDIELLLDKIVRADKPCKGHRIWQFLVQYLVDRRAVKFGVETAREILNNFSYRVGRSTDDKVRSHRGQVTARAEEILKEWQQPSRPVVAFVGAMCAVPMRCSACSLVWAVACVLGVSATAALKVLGSAWGHSDLESGRLPISRVPTDGVELRRSVTLGSELIHACKPVANPTPAAPPLKEPEVQVPTVPRAPVEDVPEAERDYNPVSPTPSPVPYNVRSPSPEGPGDEEDREVAAILQDALEPNPVIASSSSLPTGGRTSAGKKRRNRSHSREAPVCKRDHPSANREGAETRSRVLLKPQRARPSTTKSGSSERPKGRESAQKRSGPVSASRAYEEW